MDQQGYYIGNNYERLYTTGYHVYEPEIWPNRMVYIPSLFSEPVLRRLYNENPMNHYYRLDRDKDGVKRLRP